MGAMEIKNTFWSKNKYPWLFLFRLFKSSIYLDFCGFYFPVLKSNLSHIKSCWQCCSIIVYATYSRVCCHAIVAVKVLDMLVLLASSLISFQNNSCGLMLQRLALMLLGFGVHKRVMMISF